VNIKHIDGRREPAPDGNPQLRAVVWAGVAVVFVTAAAGLAVTDRPRPALAFVVVAGMAALLTVADTRQAWSRPAPPTGWRPVRIFLWVNVWLHFAGSAPWLAAGRYGLAALHLVAAFAFAGVLWLLNRKPVSA
jgi:hypothetical protein